MQTTQNTKDRLLKLTRSLRVLRLHNPFESRKSYQCRTRLVVNTYKGCSNQCYYCYTYSYTKLSDILNPKPKDDFEENLERDVRRYCSSGLPKYPVYVSSNCEPLQQLEDKYGHTLYALRKLRENNFPVLVMTKNPSKLLEPEYSEVMDKSRTVIQVTIPFLDSRFELYAPSPRERIHAIERLTASGFQVVARIDPIVPRHGAVEGQSEKEIDSLINQLHTAGVRLIASKCLRLVPGIKKVYPHFYDQLKPYYRMNRSNESPWELNPESKQKLLTPVYEACKKYRMRMATCVDSRHVHFPASLRCDGFEETLIATR